MWTGRISRVKVGGGDSKDLPPDEEKTDRFAPHSFGSSTAGVGRARRGLGAPLSRAYLVDCMCWAIASAPES